MIEGEEGAESTECTRRFRSYIALAAHRRFAHGKRQFLPQLTVTNQCVVCFSVLGSLHSAQLHVATSYRLGRCWCDRSLETKVKDVEPGCPVCEDLSFPSMLELQWHIRSTHPPDPLPNLVIFDNETSSYGGRREQGQAHERSSGGQTGSLGARLERAESGCKAAPTSGRTQSRVGDRIIASWRRGRTTIGDRQEVALRRRQRERGLKGGSKRAAKDDEKEEEVEQSQLFLLVMKQVLQNTQQLRDALGIITLTFLLAVDHPVADMMMQGGRTYADETKKRGKDHGLGPPYLQVMVGLLEGLQSDQLKEKIEHDRRARLQAYLSWIPIQPMEDALEIVKYRKISKTAKSTVKRITLALVPPPAPVLVKLPPVAPDPRSKSNSLGHATRWKRTSA